MIHTTTFLPNHHITTVRGDASGSFSGLWEFFERRESFRMRYMLEPEVADRFFAKFDGAKQLGYDALADIMENIDRISLHLDLDGTLTEPGQARLEKRAIQLIQRLQELDVPVACNTELSHDEFLAAGGDVFRAHSTGLGLCVQHNDGSVAKALPPDFGYEMELARDFLQRGQQKSINITLVEKKVGFCFLFSAETTTREAEWTLQFVKGLVRDNDDLMFVETEDGIELCSSILSKRFGACAQMSRAPFRGCFAIGAGGGSSNERLFEVCDLSIQIEPNNNNNNNCRADTTLSSHLEMLDVLEAIAEMRELFAGNESTRGR